MNNKKNKIISSIKTNTMCGIAGIFDRSNDLSSLQNITLMTDTLRHRGPDDEGFAFFRPNTSAPQLFGGKDTPESAYHARFSYTPRLAFQGHVPENVLGVFGHRRLSILDLSPAGHQPMCNKDGTIWIVYNGEIYNFIELRHELKTLGHHFVSRTDTEVILHAYEEWGETCLQRFNGMWAFVLYDTTKNILFGARDRFGVKPLYYYHDNAFFTFASELKAFIALPFYRKAINPQAVFNYLVLEINEPEGESFFKDCYEVPPSHAFHFDVSASSLKFWRYYTLPVNTSWESFEKEKEKTYIQIVKEHLFHTVESHLQSDVSIGSCLSGGVDSSSIVCMINDLLQKNSIQQIGEKQKVFTASYPLTDIDESPWAALVVQNTESLWQQAFPNSGDFLNDLEDLIYTQDIPFISTSMYAQYRVMKLAKKHGLKILLDGQGGDELFAGYAPFYGIFFFEMLKNKAFITSCREAKKLENAPIKPNAVFTALLRHIGVHTLPASLIALQRRRNAQKKNEYSYYNHTFRGIFEEDVESKNKITTSSLNTLLYEQMTGNCLSSLLRYEDRNSTRFSIEARTPFADDINLIETVFSIPSAYKIHHGWSKHLLRKAMQGIVPKQILTRKDKVGFATPEYHWLQEQKSKLRQYFVGTYEFLNEEKIFRDWEQLIHNQNQNGITTIWRFINFAIWKHVYGL